MKSREKKIFFQVDLTKRIGHFRSVRLFLRLVLLRKEHPSLGMPSGWNGVKTQLNGLQQLVEVAEEGVLLPIY